MVNSVDIDDSSMPIETFNGHLGIEGSKYEITFDVWSGEDGRLCFSVEPISNLIYLECSRRMGRPGLSSEELTIEGVSSSGKKMTSKSITAEPNISSNACRINIEARIAEIEIPQSEKIQLPFMQLWCRGLKCFRASRVETALGLLQVLGASKGFNYDAMDGTIQLEASEGKFSPKWKKDALEFLKYMNNGLALANGGRLQVPRIDYYFGNKSYHTYYHGSGCKMEFPVFYHLNLDPIINALVARYEEKGVISDIVWTALGWMQSDTTYDDLRYLTGMTALETIIDGRLRSADRHIIKKVKFVPIQNKLLNLLDDMSGISVNIRESYKDAIRRMNRRTLAEKTEAVFKQYGMSRNDFSEDVLKTMRTLRDRITHTGIIPDDQDIWDKILLIRELITRIILHEIGYEGRYCCYIGGLHDRDFPSCERVG